MVGRSSRRPSRQLSHMGFTEPRDGGADGEVEGRTERDRDRSCVEKTGRGEGQRRADAQAGNILRFP